MSARETFTVETAPASVSPSFGTESLLLLCILMAIVALAAICSTVHTRRIVRRTAREAQEQGEAMREILRSLRMAETIAGVGLWQFDYETGLQNWSEGLKRLFGIEHDAEMHEGDAETLLCANNIDLVGKVRQHKSLIEPYLLEFELFGFDGKHRAIAIQACNLRNGEGAVQRVVAVVRETAAPGIKEHGLNYQSGGAAHGTPDLRQLPCGEDDTPTDIDPLTGLADRRSTMRELDRLVISSRAARKPLVLVLFDIDHFKRVNELYGTAEGDRLLEQVAHITRSQARNCDFVGRVGGEEFALILPAVSDGVARVITERLRQSISRESGRDAVPPVTISVGFATVQAGDSALSLFARADQALYEAKHFGRNRVRVAA